MAITVPQCVGRYAAATKISRHATRPIDNAQFLGAPKVSASAGFILASNPFWSTSTNKYGALLFGTVVRYRNTALFPRLKIRIVYSRRWLAKNVCHSDISSPASGRTL